jgi:hypothetical protein
MLAPSVVTGLGASAAIPTSANAVVGAVSMEAVGKAAGANGMLRELGGVFGIAVAVAVFAGAGSYASAAAFSDGFAAAIGVAAALSLAGAVTAMALPARRDLKSTNDEESRNDQLPGRVAGVQNGA